MSPTDVPRGVVTDHYDLAPAALRDAESFQRVHELPAFWHDDTKSVNHCATS
jgi:hypothetical protein